jgi:transglutaminase-like putative cysteine protease
MILEVQHETRLEYSEPVMEAVAELRMEPVSDLDQSCRSFHLAVHPETEIFRYQGGFGNRVHHFNLLREHRAVRILAASVVETHPRALNLASSAAVLPVPLESAELEVLDFLPFRGPVRATPRLTALCEGLQPKNAATIADVLVRLLRFLGEKFEYARDVTQASSPVDDILEQGKGVCQDFAHLMIAILRHFGIPARYVSGYIHRPNKESQSHAWCEAWLPDLGWLGVDPTNNQLVNDHYVKVAVGRDFTDVPPNKGVYRGAAAEAIFVRVETRLLERLPSLSWQEELPPLNIPLTAIRPRSVREGAPAADQDMQEQQ